jgi:hypothetical protein
LLKNFVRYCLAVFCESLCSSAAEKRDYAVFRLPRQLILFCSARRFLRIIVRCRSRTRTIANLCEDIQVLLRQRLISDSDLTRRKQFRLIHLPLISVWIPRSARCRASPLLENSREHLELFAVESTIWC